MTPIDQAIQKLDDKISVLTLAKQELIAVRDDNPAPDVPKKRGRRKKAGLPTQDTEHAEGSAFASRK